MQEGNRREQKGPQEVRWSGLVETVRKWLPTAGFMLLGALALHYANAARVTTLSGQLPAFSAPASDGTTIRSADLNGKVTILNFWSPG